MSLRQITLLTVAVATLLLLRGWLVEAPPQVDRPDLAPPEPTVSGLASYEGPTVLREAEPRADDVRVEVRLIDAQDPDRALIGAIAWANLFRPPASPAPAPPDVVVEHRAGFSRGWIPVKPGFLRLLAHAPGHELTFTSVEVHAGTESVSIALRPCGSVEVRVENGGAPVTRPFLALFGGDVSEMRRYYPSEEATMFANPGQEPVLLRWPETTPTCFERPPIRAQDLAAALRDVPVVDARSVVLSRGMHCLRAARAQGGVTHFEDVPAGRYLFLARIEGFTDAIAPDVVVRPGEHTVVNIGVKEALPFGGQVRLRGRPLDLSLGESADIYLWRHRLPSALLASTGERGRFAIPLARNNRSEYATSFEHARRGSAGEHSRIRVIYHPPGDPSTTYFYFDDHHRTADGDRANGWVIDLHQRNPVEVRVRDEAGRPVPGAEVTIERFWPDTFTNDEGLARIYGVDPSEFGESGHITAEFEDGENDYLGGVDFGHSVEITLRGLRLGEEHR